MTTALIAAALSLSALSPQGGQAQQPSGSEIVGKMLAHYYGANTATGKIKLTQSMMNHSVVIETTLQFEKPSKLYIKQVQTGKSGQRTWLVTSDGKSFAYDPPSVVISRKPIRLMEAVQQNDKTLDVRDIYRAIVESLGDRSAPLDVVIGRREDLEFLQHQLATVRYAGRDKVGETEVNVITGDWREYGAAPVSGTYQMLITDAGELKRYARKETLAVAMGNGQSLPPQDVLTVWDVDVQVNGKPDPALFKVVR
ncbi:MAG TPA: hypothetical protein VEX38_02430 [Fimbriimonadaceae bacterium]|nr:hypothetical protein [Fimbriimonadaceae bacterium]